MLQSFFGRSESCHKVAELVDAFYWHIYRAQDVLDLKEENSLLLGTVDGLRARVKDLEHQLEENIATYGKHIEP
jgi:hypothetical protein